jgi:Concanavalin A-like lectin/glucanases superfamily
MRRSTIITLTGIMMSASAVFADESSLIAHWPMNEGKGTEIKDVSGNHHHGKLLNAENSKWVDGRSGKALLFDNSKAKLKHHSCVVIPEIAGKHDFSKGMTVEAWIRLAPTVKRVGGMYYIFSNVNSTNGPGLFFLISWKRLLMQSGNGKKTFWVAVSSTGKNPFIAKKWYHVAGTYDGSVYTLYINGVKAAISKPGAKLTKGIKKLSIGAFHAGYVDGFDGVISDVKLYSKARTPLEIVKAAKGI